MATTQTAKAILAAVEAALKAAPAVTSLLGVGADSIYQYHDEVKLLKAMRLNPKAKTPAIVISNQNSQWLNAGRTHDRIIRFLCYVVVYDTDGFGARQDKAKNVIEKIYETLIENTLGLANPELGKMDAITDDYSHEQADKNGNPIEASTWVVTFETQTTWHK